MWTEHYIVRQNNYKGGQLLRILRWGKYHYKVGQLQNYKVGQKNYKVGQLLQSRGK